MSPDVFKQPPPLPTDDQFLVDLYARLDVPVDALPYTEEFDRLYSEFNQGVDCQKTKEEVMHRLLTLRKAAILPRLGHHGFNAVNAAGEDTQLIERLVKKHVGSLGSRDRLPYTEEFQKLVAEFNDARTSPPATEQAVWNLVCRVSK